MTLRIAMFASFVIGTFALHSAAYAQSVHRDYDVRDMVLNIPDFADAPSFSVPATQPAVFPPLPKGDDKADATAREQAINEVTAWLRESARHGEPAIQIVEDGGHLGIDATQAQHERITRLIELRVAERKTQASVEVRYLFLTPEAEDAIDETLRDVLALSRGPGGHNRPGIDLSAEQVDALVKSGQAHVNSTLMTAPRITLFNGQRAYVLIATERGYIADYTKQVDAAGVGSWEPVKKAVQTGVLLDVRCRVNVPTQTVACDVNTTFNRLLDLKSEPFAAAGVDANLKIEKPDVDHAELHALLAARDGGTKLYHIARKASDTRLYVLVKPTIVQAP